MKLALYLWMGEPEAINEWETVNEIPWDELEYKGTINSYGIMALKRLEGVYGVETHKGWIIPAEEYYSNDNISREVEND